MSQQINLFNPIFLKQKKYFSAVTMAQSLALIVFGSILAVAYASYQSSRLQQETGTLAGQLAQAQAQLATVNATVGARPKNKVLEQEILKLDAENKATQQVFEILKSGDFGNTKGYADYFRAFARQIVDGVWLTGFNILGAGNEIGLRGRALQGDLVPAYITRLKLEQVMQGKSFATLEMMVPMINPSPEKGALAQKPVLAGYIEFNLQSQNAGKDDADPSKAKK
ncbi:hypothetical protein BH11PSE11_BH11PSE11_11340 [soil metagenome]